MKTIFFISFLGLMASCANQKEMVKESQVNETQTEQAEAKSNDTAQNNYRIIGYVRKDKDKCDYCIEAEVEPGVTKFLYAVNLDEKYKQDGLKIKFDYNLSRGMLPKECAFADMTVAIRDVSIMRR